MKVFICGLTGTGKSTISKAIASALNYEYLQSSAMFREFAGLDKKKKGFWTHKEGQEFTEKRLNSDIDEKFDKYLLDIVDKKEDFVIESWTMPWLYPEKAIRIYLKAPFSVRVNRVMFRDKLNQEEAKVAVKLKDSETRKIYLQKYLFDITKDLDNFDFVLNTQYFDARTIVLYVLDFVKMVEKYYN